MRLRAAIAAALARIQDRHRQRRLLELLNLRRTAGRQDPWPCTDADAPRVLAAGIAFAAGRGNSPDLAETLRRMGVAVREEEGLAARIGADVRLVRAADGAWSLLLDANVCAFPARAALAWAADRRVSGAGSETFEITDVRIFARSLLEAPRHPLLQILLPEAAVAEARRIHGGDLARMARRLRVPPALLAAAQS